MRKGSIMVFDGEFEPVIGLEVHAQLATKTKIFCSCSTAFNSPSNANICPICAGHPGVLPVLNRQALEFAIRAGLATQCRINSQSTFARKNYFYPDLPKGYQISQYDKPLCEDGFLKVENERIGIQRIHMEEDAGKSVHASGYSLVNLNRAGVPLIEIVSRPEIKSAQQAAQYLRKLHGILVAIKVNDGNLEEGSFRCDANVSVRPRGSKALGTRVEIKNVNSFRFVEKAIEYEINRQIQVIRSGAAVVQETRGFDSGKGVTTSLRSKEEAHDYRYFPDPDLPTLEVNSSWVQKILNELPELPDQKRDRYVRDLGISSADSEVIVSFNGLAPFFEEVVSMGSDPKEAAKWILGELLRLMKARSQENVGHDSWSSQETLQVKPDHLHQLIQLVRSGALSNNLAKQVFEEVFQTGQDPQSIVETKGLRQVSDSGAIEATIDRILDENSNQVQQYLAGKDKLLGFFFGLVMKQMGGKANPTIVNEVLKRKLQSKASVE